MKTNLVGSYWFLTELPVWATALLLYSFTLGVYSFFAIVAKEFTTKRPILLGDGALIAVVLMATGILQRGGLFPPSEWFHIWALALGIVIGVGWWLIGWLDGFGLLIDQEVSHEMQWGDIYHHLVIAPLLVYLFVTLLPVIYKNGTSVEKVATICLILLVSTLYLRCNDRPSRPTQLPRSHQEQETLKSKKP